jgi:ferrous iron transport protein B
MSDPETSNKNQLPTLADLHVGQRARVRKVLSNGLIRRRLLDLGFVPGTPVDVLLESPLGDPRLYRVRETNIALRRADARTVEMADRPDPENRGHRAALTHGRPNGPGPGRPPDNGFHYRVAIAGNPNTGKSTVFNALTGLRQHVGNWPGKTVTRNTGTFIDRGKRIQLVDLPGTYSLLSASVEEEIARDFILFGAPDCTVAVADATALERNLNLVFQILEITDRAVVCLNLIDEARRRGIRILRKKLEKDLGVPVVLTAARYGEGLVRLKDKILGVAGRRIATAPVRIPYEPQLQEAIDELVPLIESAFPDLPNARWIALRLIDGGDPRLRREFEDGLLSDAAGRTGDRSLTGMSPTAKEIRR